MDEVLGKNEILPSLQNLYRYNRPKLITSEYTENQSATQK